MTDVIMHFAVHVQDLEARVVTSTGWPAYLVRTIWILFVLLGAVSGLQVIFDKGVAAGPAESSRTSRRRDGGKGREKDSASFFWFQMQYLSVYLIVMLADWLQGPNMYTLYTSYGVDVGTLFITGFLSSAIFGTFLGVYVDTWGRRLGCIVFCVLEIIINLLEHVPNFTTLMVGRIMGGMTTSLLFSAFESWMVSEHRRRGFKEEWLPHTFALASSGNGVVAILAGFIAQVSADFAGDIGPFQVAIALTVVALVLVLRWEENYGEPVPKPAEKQMNRAKGGKNRSGDHSRSRSRGGGKATADDGDVSMSSSSSFSTTTTGTAATTTTSGASALYTSVLRAFSGCWSSTPILCLGLSQAIFEGAIYTFVFMWVKVLGMLLGKSNPVHTGLVMTCFMLSMTIGGSASAWLLPSLPGGAHSLTVFVYLLAAIAMLIPILSYSFLHVFVAFLVLEFTVGIFNSCGGTLRSQYYPEAQQSAIMTVFRIPLNAFVVLGTQLSYLTLL